MIEPYNNLLNASKYVMIRLIATQSRRRNSNGWSSFRADREYPTSPEGNGPANRLALLQMIAAHGQIHPSQLAEELEVNQSSITRQVRILEDEGDLVVSADPGDSAGRASSS